MFSSRASQDRALVLLPCQTGEVDTTPFADYLSGVIAAYAGVPCHRISLPGYVLYPPDEQVVAKLFEQAAGTAAARGLLLAGLVLVVLPAPEKGMARGFPWDAAQVGAYHEVVCPFSDLLAGVVMTAQLLLREAHWGVFDEIGGIRYVTNRDGQQRFLNAQGVAFARAGRYEQARAAWIPALEPANDNAASALLSIGQSYADEGNHEEAVDWFTMAIDAPSGERSNRAIGYFDRGLAYEALGQRSRAEQDFRSAIRTDSKFGWAMNALGRSLAESGSLAEAEQWLNACLDLPDDTSIGLGDVSPTARANLSWVRAKK